MRMSAFCRLSRRGPTATGRMAQGFTLLEVMVVTALLALIASIAVPNLQRVSEGLGLATQRDAMLSDISMLGYRAWVLGQGFRLDAEGLSQPLRDGQPVLVLPAGWRLRAESPIVYSFTGHCAGGVLTLQGPGGTTERVVLAAPLCKVQRLPS